MNKTNIPYDNTAEAEDVVFCGTLIGTTTPPMRIEKNSPDGYRLAKKQDGTLVLQGAFMWQQGNRYGQEWRDIPTVDLSESLGENT